MIATIQYKKGEVKIDLSKGKDISISVSNNDGVSAWYLERSSIEPVRTEHFTGSVAEGGSVNFRNITFNPHSHCTHTECVGHISKEQDFYINDFQKEVFFDAFLISVKPQLNGVDGEFEDVNDLVISKVQLQELIGDNKAESIIIRTLPNTEDKLHSDYSSTNPIYLKLEAIEWLKKQGFKHLIIDGPSVDRENDGGKLIGHHAWFGYPHNVEKGVTITEFVYIADEIKDGRYFVNLQLAPFQNDATPSRPILFDIL